MKLKKILSLVLVAMMSVSILAGCGSSSAPSTTDTTKTESAATANTESADAAKAESSAAGSTAETSAAEASKPESKSDDMKVVSLAPNITEILFAIGADEMIVGRTDYCNYPAEAANIDSIGTYSAPNMELIISKSPSLVIASDFIDENIKKQLEDLGAEVYVFKASDVNEVEEQILSIGEKLGLKENAEKVVDNMKATSELIEEKGKTIETKKTVFVDLGSYYTAGPGSFLNNVLNDIYTVNIAESTGEMWPQMSVETIVSANPDVYISTFTSADDLRAVSGFSSLECMKDGNLLVLDQELADCIQRAGPRLCDAELKLMELIYG